MRESKGQAGERARAGDGGRERKVYESGGIGHYERGRERGNIREKKRTRGSWGGRR